VFLGCLKLCAGLILPPPVPSLCRGAPMTLKESIGKRTYYENNGDIIDAYAIGQLEK